MLFRTNEILFRTNEIIFRTNEILFRTNEIKKITTLMSLYGLRIMEYIMFKIKQCNNKIDEDHSNYS